jgi:DNA-binding IclR family transcriptional regulator
MPPQSGGIQSIGRAFAILEAVARSRDGITLAELSRQVGLHTSTAFHLVRTLVGLGYVRQLAEDKRYRIGRPLFALAASALDEIEMVSLANPVLADLAETTGECGHFAVWMNDAVIVIARTAGQGAFQLSDRVGVVRPAHCTALGKVLLAALPDAQLDRWLKRAELTPHTPRAIVKPAALRRAVLAARRDGIGIDDGEFNEEVRCAAVAVRDFTGRVIGALGLSAPVWRVSLKELEAKARHVRAAAARLSAEFGYRPA